MRHTSASCVFICLILPISGHYDYPHFTREEPKALGHGSCHNHTRSWKGSGFEPGKLDSGINADNHCAYKDFNFIHSPFNRHLLCASYIDMCGVTQIKQDIALENPSLREVTRV